MRCTVIDIGGTDVKRGHSGNKTGPGCALSVGGSGYGVECIGYPEVRLLRNHSQILFSELARALVTWVALRRCLQCLVSSCQEEMFSSALRGICYNLCFWAGSPQVQVPAGSRPATHLP